MPVIDRSLCDCRYAINVFYTLSPIATDGGGTEFALGSHQWGESYSKEPCYAAKTCATKVFEGLPPGTAIFVSTTYERPRFKAYVRARSIYGADRLIVGAGRLPSAPPRYGEQGRHAAPAFGELTNLIYQSLACISN